LQTRLSPGKQEAWIGRYLSDEIYICQFCQFNARRSSLDNPSMNELMAAAALGFYSQLTVAVDLRFFFGGFVTLLISVERYWRSACCPYIPLA
jgi:hypothetical protein